MAVNSSNIIATNSSNTASNAGGIIGYYRGATQTTTVSYYNEKALFYLRHSFCTNSNIQANKNAGGLIGEFMYGNIEYCYVGNTNIRATKENAGGLIGRLDNSSMNDRQYIAKMSYNFIANNDLNLSVSSLKGVGGIIGSAYTDILSGNNTTQDYFRNMLVVTNLYSEGSDFVSTEVGRIENKKEITTDEEGNVVETYTGNEAYGDVQSANMSKIFAYEDYIINGTTISGTYKSIKDSNTDYKYECLNANDLSNTNIYTNAAMLKFQDSNGRYKFESGYFPVLNTLTASATQTYWGADYLNVTQDKISIPTVTALQTLNSSMLTLRKTPSENELPEIYTYASDINKLNIEFSNVSPYTYFEIKTDECVLVEQQVISERVYTLEYDYKTPIKIVVSNLQNWYTQEINPEEVKNLLDIVNDEYLYMSGNTIYSSRKEISGEYLNLYRGKALSTNGDIYDISNMSVINTANNKIQLLEEVKPLSEYEYDNTIIQTFYHSSKVIQEDKTYIYKEQQIFVKNDNIYLIDGTMKNIGNAVILDSYNNNYYQTTLGTDGVLYDLLTEIKYPKDFKNKDIIAITNNIDNNINEVLVYYLSGKVIGFNYITGELVYDNNVKLEDENIISYMLESLSFDDVLYEMEDSSYDEAKILTEKLETVSIDEALKEIEQEKEFDGNNIKDIETNNNKNNSKYITTYNPKTQNYVVYSSTEILKAEVTPTKSENEKISEDTELISYYTNLSTSRNSLNGIGIVIFILTLSSICVILIVMYKKNKIENR